MADKRVPDPLASSKEYARFYHLGLCELENSEIVEELDYLKPLLYGEPEDSWLRQRVARLEAEIQRRQEPKARHAGGRQ